MEFKPWPKITRVENRRTPVFTEKLDGTNACIAIGEDGEFQCQSRNRIIKPGDDNYGFAAWAHDNKDELLKMGPGYHFGEWWGKGVGRGYDMTEKVFSLFNTKRWGEHNENTPKCVQVVPMLRVSTVEEAREFLTTNGSVAAPGYMNPEGAIMLDIDSDTYFKIIINK